MLITDKAINVWLSNKLLKNENFESNIFKKVSNKKWKIKHVEIQIERIEDFTKSLNPIKIASESQVRTNLSKNSKLYLIFFLFNPL